MDRNRVAREASIAHGVAKASHWFRQGIDTASFEAAVEPGDGYSMSLRDGAEGTPQQLLALHMTPPGCFLHPRIVRGFLRSRWIVSPRKMILQKGCRAETRRMFFDCRTGTSWRPVLSSDDSGGLTLTLQSSLLSVLVWCSNPPAPCRVKKGKSTAMLETFDCPFVKSVLLCEGP